MKLKDDYILRELMGEYVLIPVGKTAIEDNSLTILTETGGLIVKTLQQDCSSEDILAKLLEEYEVSEEEARRDMDEFLALLRENNMLDE